MYEPGTRIAYENDGKPVTGTIVRAEKNKEGVPIYVVDQDQEEGFDIIDGKESKIQVTRKRPPTMKEREKQFIEMTPPVKDMTLVEMLNYHRDQLAEIEKVKEHLKNLQQEADSYLERCKDRMDAEQLKNCKFERPDGTTLTAYRHKIYSPRVADKTLFSEWCQAFGIEQSAFTMWSAGKFKAFVKSLEKDDLPLPAGVEAFEDERLQFRRG